MKWILYDFMGVCIIHTSLQCKARLSFDALLYKYEISKIS
jgi:hypothetical protein